jgi:hypothetical protein
MMHPAQSNLVLPPVSSHFVPFPANKLFRYNPVRHRVKRLNKRRISNSSKQGVGVIGGRAIGPGRQALSAKAVVAAAAAAARL